MILCLVQELMIKIKHLTTFYNNCWFFLSNEHKYDKSSIDSDMIEIETKNIFVCISDTHNSLDEDFIRIFIVCVKCVLIVLY